MQYPVFHRTLPPYANLATLGSMLGNEVVQAVDEGGALISRAGPGLPHSSLGQLQHLAPHLALRTGRHYLPNGTVSDWWSQDTSSRFSDARQCVKDHFSNVVVGPFNDEDNTLVQVLHLTSIKCFLNFEIFGYWVKRATLFESSTICLFSCKLSWMLSAL